MQITQQEFIDWLNSENIQYSKDENDFLTVFGDLDINFRNWVYKNQYTYLPANLIKINGSLNIENTFIRELVNLQIVDGNCCLKNTNLTSLGKLHFVGRSLNIINTNIGDLEHIKYIGGKVFLIKVPENVNRKFVSANNIKESMLDERNKLIDEIDIMLSFLRHKIEYFEEKFVP